MYILLHYVWLFIYFAYLCNINLNESLGQKQLLCCLMN